MQSPMHWVLLVCRRHCFCADSSSNLKSSGLDDGGHGVFLRPQQRSLKKCMALQKSLRKFQLLSQPYTLFQGDQTPSEGPPRSVSAVSLMEL